MEANDNAQVVGYDVVPIPRTHLRNGRSKWREIIDNLPVGKALQVPCEGRNHNHVRNTLYLYARQSSVKIHVSASVGAGFVTVWRADQ